MSVPIEQRGAECRFPRHNGSFSSAIPWPKSVVVGGQLSMTIAFGQLELIHGLREFEEDCGVYVR